MKKILLGILAVALFFVCGLLIASPLVNDSVARKTASELSKIPVPENSEYIESVSRAGKLVGCGNGMQYFGAILVRSELSLETLQEYYSEFAEYEWECIVKPQRGSQIDVIEHGSLKFETEAGNEGYYIVYSWGSNDGITGEFDIRGH